MKHFSKICSFFAALLLGTLFILSSQLTSVDAAAQTTYLNLSDLTYSLDGLTYQSIPEYASLDGFLKDNNSNNLSSVYLTDFLYDGVSAVKSPDLDDYISSGEIGTLKIKVLNLNTTGNYELTGETTGLMVGVNTNNREGEINLILNNVKIDTDSKKAPAVYVYNRDKNYTSCKVTIKTKNGTENSLTGGKLKKVSLLASDELSTYAAYYSSDNLTNYEKYVGYYGLYTSSEIEHILFATVQADSEDLQDGDPYYFYKASGAVSSDIDLYFEGEGRLTITSKNKEGIETKGNLSLLGGTGDYEVYAQDDCLNTTTANSSGVTVRNDIEINVGSLLAVVSDDGDEGDAIDSNGTLTISGGTIYAFAHSSSEDSGLDSENGIFLNGGTIISTGNMTDSIASGSTQNYLYASFNSAISPDTLLVIKDENDEIIAAFRTSKTIKTLLYSSPDLSFTSYKIYSGGSIDGEETNGLYTKINSYSGGTEVTYSDASLNRNMSSDANRAPDISSVLLGVWLTEIFALVLVSVVAWFLHRKAMI